MASYNIDPISIDFDPGEFLAPFGNKGGTIPLSRELDRLTRETVEDLAEFAADRIREHAPFDSGNLWLAIYNTRAVRNRATGIFHAEAGVDEQKAPYAWFVEAGTGIYGPTGNIIEAGEGNIFAVLKDPDAGRDDGDPYVYFKSSEGQPAQEFVEKAYEETDPYVDARLEILRAEYEAYVATFN
jgi:HK97 gp10 family phage protein